MEFPSGSCPNWIRLCLFSGMKNLNKVYNNMKNKITRKKDKAKKLKLINPVMRFNSGFLGYEIDIIKTKKLLKWLRKKK